MKNFYKNSANILKYVLTFSVAILILAGIIVGFLGFNKSVNLGNAYEVEINFSDADEYKSYVRKTTQVINDYGYNVRESKLEDRSYDYTMLIRFKAKNLNKLNELKTDIASALGVSESIVSVEKISNTYQSKFLVRTIIAMAVVTLILFLYGLMRKGVLVGLTYCATYLYALLVGMGFIALTRLELSITSLAILVVFAVLAVAVFVYLYEKMSQEANKTENEKIAKSQIMSDIINKNKKSLIIVGLSAFVIFAGLCCSLNLTLIYACLSAILGLIIAYVSLFLFAFPFYFTVVNYKENKVKAIMSRNNLEKTKIASEKKVATKAKTTKKSTKKEK